mmetsp:Transcript_128109/g.239786  ORF Transcript_128109/g.239786 Transcript_128109/m.239786 type:complete len:222 (-) Transcript_128109:95-760(-)
MLRRLLPLRRHFTRAYPINARVRLQAYAFRYSAWMKSRPLVASCTSTCAIFTCGDVLSQSLEINIQKFQSRKAAKGISEASGQVEAKKQFDPVRSLRFSVFGFFIAGPMYTWWFAHALPRLVQMTEATPRLVAKKVCCDMTLGSLIFDTTSIFWINIFKGGSPSEAITDVKERFWTVYKADIACFAPFQCVNFTFIPNYMQPTSMALFSVVWSMVLSVLLN